MTKGVDIRFFNSCKCDSQVTLSVDRSHHVTIGGGRGCCRIIIDMGVVCCFTSVVLVIFAQELNTIVPIT